MTRELNKSRRKTHRQKFERVGDLKFVGDLFRSRRRRPRARPRSSKTIGGRADGRLLSRKRSQSSLCVIPLRCLTPMLCALAQRRKSRRDGKSRMQGLEEGGAKLLWASNVCRHLCACLSAMRKLAESHAEATGASTGGQLADRLNCVARSRVDARVEPDDGRLMQRRRRKC